jgi:hypothetical protein
MDAKALEIVRRLYAEVTAILEEAHESAVKGQSHKMTITHYEAQVGLLRTAMIDAELLAEAAAVIARRMRPRKPK